MAFIARINSMDRNAFVEALGAIYEHSPWVAERAFAGRPFASLDDLHRAMNAVVASASGDEQLALIRAHPELAGGGTLGASSTGEQARLGFDRLERAELERMAQLNRRYRERHGMPCIVALKLHASRASVQAEFERRIANERETEIRGALEQIGHIARGRLEKLEA
jgi:OHCU decarboxylase